MPDEPHREHLLKIGVSGVRGVVGEFFTPSIACAFAQAFGTYVGAGRVVVGRDTRTSGPMLTHAVTSGLLAAGCEVRASRRHPDAQPAGLHRRHPGARRPGDHGLAQPVGVQRRQAVQR